MGAVLSRSSSIEVRKQYLKKTPFFLLASHLESSKLLDELAAASKLKTIQSGALVDKLQKGTFIVVCEGELTHVLLAPVSQFDAAVIARRKVGDFFRLFESEFLTKVDKMLGAVQIRATQKTLILVIAPAALNSVLKNEDSRRPQHASGDPRNTIKVERQFKSMLDALKQDLTQQLVKVPCFSIFTPKQRAVLAQLFTFEVLDAHSELFAKDSPGSSFYILVEGTLDLYTEEHGKEFRIASLDPPAFLGEIALLYSCPRTCSVRSVDSVCALLCLSKENFNGLLREAPELRGAVESEQRSRTVATFLAYSGLCHENKLTKEVCQEVANHLVINKVDPGTVILHKGKPSLSFFMLLQGEMESTGVDGIKGDKPVEYTSGSHFGGIDMLLNRPSLHTVAAVSTCLLLEAKGRSFFRMLACIDVIKYEFQLRTMGGNVTLEAVLNHRACFDTFREFQRAEFAEESTQFYVAVQEFNRLYAEKRDTAKLVKAANEIVDLYIVDGSDRCVNLPSTVASTCAKAVRAGDFSSQVFDQPLQEILNLMSKDTLFRFKRDERYCDLRARLRSPDIELDRFDLASFEEAWAASIDKEESGTLDDRARGVKSAKGKITGMNSGTPHKASPQGEIMTSAEMAKISVAMELTALTILPSLSTDSGKSETTDAKATRSHKRAKTAKVVPDGTYPSRSSITWVPDADTELK